MSSKRPPKDGFELEIRADKSRKKFRTANSMARVAERNAETLIQVPAVRNNPKVMRKIQESVQKSGEDALLSAIDDACDKEKAQNASSRRVNKSGLKKSHTHPRLAKPKGGNSRRPNSC